MNNSKIHPDFLEFESKVNQVAKLIDDMIAAQTAEGEQGADVKAINIDNVDLENFIATTDKERTHKIKSTRLRCEGDKEAMYESSEEDELFGTSKHLRISENASKRATDSSRFESRRGTDSARVTTADFSASLPKQRTSEQPQEMDKFTFMQQLEEDADKRAAQRRQRENIAQEFRTLGNNSFRKLNYERAILMYTKAIEHVKDSPILYNNRAMCYIKLKNYKRALIDCDYVLNKLDNRNLRSWIYRAAASKRNLEPQEYASSIRMAKETNSKQHALINEYVLKIEQDLF